MRTYIWSFHQRHEQESGPKTLITGGVQIVNEVTEAGQGVFTISAVNVSAILGDRSLFTFNVKPLIFLASCRTCKHIGVLWRMTMCCKSEQQSIQPKVSWKQTRAPPGSDPFYHKLKQQEWGYHTNILWRFAVRDDADRCQKPGSATTSTVTQARLKQQKMRRSQTDQLSEELILKPTV